MDNSLCWLTLSRVKGVGNRTLLRMLNKNKELSLTADHLWKAPEHRLVAEYGLKPAVAHSIAEQKGDTSKAKELIEQLNSQRVEVLIFEDEGYPDRLRAMKNPPFILYCCGNIDLLNRKPLGITGSRDISLKGLELAYKFAEVLVDKGVTIVKGSTRELDALTHIATEETAGCEITVLSNGILSFLKQMPSAHKKIERGKHLFLSFVDPTLDWTPYAERLRNRIVLTLSEAAVVIETRRDGIIVREGSKALSEGKKLFVVRYEDYPENATGNRILMEKGGIPISASASIDNLQPVIESVSIDRVEPEVGDLETKRGRQKKELAQYFTPIEVVEFIYQMLGALRWSERCPEPKIIDPACGEGIFLKYALDNGIAEGDDLYGCDIDSNIRRKWDGLQIAKKIKLHIHNGLLDDGELGIERDRFDLAIGNPPYGGTGLGELARLAEDSRTTASKGTTAPLSLFEKEVESTEFALTGEPKVEYCEPLTGEKKRELISLANLLAGSYELWKKAEIIDDQAEEESNREPTDLFAGLETLKPGRKRVDLIVERLRKQRLLGKGREQLHLSAKELKKLISFPIEVLFAERFLQLVTPGGYVAIIIPDGFLANINLRYVREWIFKKAKACAVVSLPRETFKYIGTTAKTSILFLRKYKKGEALDRNAPIFMASAEYVGVDEPDKNDLPLTLEEFKKFLEKEKGKRTHLSPMFTQATGEDVQRTGRMDPDYWDPKYRRLEREMKKFFRTKPLGEFMSFISYGQVGKRYYHKKGEVRYLQVINIVRTGVDHWLRPAWIKEGSRNDPPRSRLKTNDIGLVNHGVGSIGRCITISRDPGKVNISQDIDVIRVHAISPFYVSVFINTRFGQQQIERQCTGVSGIVYIRFDDIRSIQIPLLPERLQQRIKREYKRMSRWHDRAMEIKEELIKSGLSNKEAEKDPEYIRRIQKAEDLLTDLIRRTEEVIEGKRKDI